MDYMNFPRGVPTSPTQTVMDLSLIISNNRSDLAAGIMNKTEVEIISPILKE